MCKQCIHCSFVSQSQQMRKKEREEKTHFENVDTGLIAIQTHTIYILFNYFFFGETYIIIFFEGIFNYLLKANHENKLF